MGQRGHEVLRDVLGHLIGGLTLIDGARHPLRDVPEPRRRNAGGAPPPR